MTKQIKTLDTANLVTVTGGCAACGNPAHTPTQASQQAGQWAGQAAPKAWNKR